MAVSGKRTIKVPSSVLPVGVHEVGIELKDGRWHAWCWQEPGLIHATELPGGPGDTRAEHAFGMFLVIRCNFEQAQADALAHALINQDVPSD